MYPKKKFDRDSRFGPKRAFGRAQLFSATCVDCGNECQVPFQPTGNRPGFCRDCFKNQGEGSSSAPAYAAPKKWESRGADEKLMYPAECDSCHNNCKVPFKPIAGRPVYCHRCMAAQNNGGTAASFVPVAHAGAPTGVKLSDEHFKILNAKLDKLLGILELVTADLSEEELEELPAVQVETKKKPTRGQTKRAKRTGKTK